MIAWMFGRTGRGDGRVEARRAHGHRCDAQGSNGARLGAQIAEKRGQRQSVHRCELRQMRASSSVFFASYSAAVMAPASRSLASSLSVAVISAAAPGTGAGAVEACRADS